MRKYLLYGIVIIMVAFATGCVYAQGDTTKTTAKEGEQSAPAAAPAGQAMTPAPTATPAPETPKMSELSIYGEVQNINVQANSMTVQYYDYDNDEEKSTEISLDSNSKLENANAIGDIKKGDWVDVTYTASSGKNIAKTVSVEKEEPVQEETPQAVVEE